MEQSARNFQPSSNDRTFQAIFVSPNQIFYRKQSLGAPVNLREEINLNQNIKPLSKIQTTSYRILKQRYTALTSMNVQTRLCFISAAVDSVKFLFCCSCSGATFGLFFSRLQKIYLLIRIKNSHCLQNNMNLSMKIKLL